MRIVLTALLLALLATAAGAENLLKDPSFEEVDAGRPAGWAVAGHAWYEEPKGSGLSEAAADDAVLQGAGHRSLRMAGKGNRGMARQVLRYDPAWGKRLRLSGWMRLQEMHSACGRIIAEFIGDGDKWLGQAGVATDWRKSTADWERFEREFDVPEGTRYLAFSCGTDKANSGIVWFDNLALEPVAPAPAPAPEPAGAEAEAVVPIDTFEGEPVAWFPNAWGGSTPARFSLRREGGAGFLHVECPSAKANMVDRAWNYDGKWDALSFRIRKTSGGGSLTLYYVCGSVYFQAKWVAPTAEWRKVSIFNRDVGYSWGAKSDEEKVFDPGKLTKLSFGHDEAIEFDLADVALDVRDDLSVRSAYTETRANLFSPGERPVVKAELLNAYAAPASATLSVEVVDHRGKRVSEQSRLVELPARAYSTESITLPPLRSGYFAARVRLVRDGRVAGQRSVGLCVPPAPVPAGKAFMGASGFGMGAEDADIGARLGVRASEFFVSWAQCEPERGALRIEGFAKALDAYEKHGFETTGMLLIRPEDVPGWASAAADPKEHDRHLARDAADFGRFVEALVGRYKARVHRWAFCCEVDLAVHQWARGFDGYVEMVRAGAEGAKRANPRCLVGGIGVSGVDCTRNPRFPVARRLWEQLGDCLDGIFFDAYASPRYFAPGLRAVGPEENDETGMVEEALRIVRARDPKKRVAIEEKGWAIDDRLPVDAPEARDEADVLARSFVLARSVDAVEHYMWFQLLTRWAEGGYSYSLFRVEGDHLNPRPGAAAYSWVARFLAGVTAPKRVALHQDLYAVTFAAGRGSRAALWTPLPDAVSLQVTLPKTARLTDLMGNEVGRGTGARQTLQLSRSPLYLWDEKTPAGTLRAALARASFHLPCARLSLDLPDAGTIRVLVRSQISGGLKGRLTVSAPAGWAVAPAAQDVALPDGRPRAITFRVTRAPSPLPRKPGVFTARLATPDRGEVRLNAQPSLITVPRLLAAPTIDGDLSEYAALPPVRLDGQQFLSPPDAPSAKLWTGIDDLSVTAWVTWDAAHLYFAAKVRDDRFVQEQSGPSVWMNDCFQIALDPLNDSPGPGFAGRSGYDPDDVEFGISLTPSGPQAFQWTGGPDANGRVLPAARLAVKRGSDATCYEWALPWSEVKALKPRPGAALGLNFVAIDADRPGEAAPYWMGLTPGICGGKDPSVFAGFVLAK